MKRFLLIIRQKFNFVALSYKEICQHYQKKLQQWVAHFDYAVQSYVFMVRSVKDNELIVAYKICFTKMFIFSFIPHQTDALISCKAPLSTNLCCKISLRMNIFKICPQLLWLWVVCHNNWLYESMYIYKKQITHKIILS